MKAVRKTGAAATFKRENSKRGLTMCPNSPMPTHRPDREAKEYNGDTRNARTVWTIATQPYKKAHFATFPSEIPRRCILAGCPPGGTVLDPFGGSGTTGAVALQLGMKAILIELNPEYVELIRERCAGVTPGFDFAA